MGGRKGAAKQTLATRMPRGIYMTYGEKERQLCQDPLLSNEGEGGERGQMDRRPHAVIYWRCICFSKASFLLLLLFPLIRLRHYGFEFQISKNKSFPSYKAPLPRY